MRREPRPPLILASASPRRRELLARLGLEFEVVEPDVDEGSLRGRAERVARRLAVAKARAVAALRPNAVVLAADTVVAQRGVILGKPRDPSEAAAMLQRLRGRVHRVVTAVAVLPPGRAECRPTCRPRRPLVDHAVTRVSMRRYTDAEIVASISRGDPFDKAGAYAIQDERLAPVSSYGALPAGRRGCYCCVVGLPLWTALRLLARAGLDTAGVRLPDLLPQCGSCPLSVP